MSQQRAYLTGHLSTDRMCPNKKRVSCRKRHIGAEEASSLRRNNRETEHAQDARDMALVLIELPRPCCREGEPFPLPPRLKGAEHRRTGDGHQARKHQTENGKPGIAGNQVVTRTPAAIANLGSSTAHLHPSNQTTPPGRLRRRAPPPPNPQGITGFNLGTEGKGWEEGISTVPSRRGAAPEGLATAVVGDTNQGFLPVPTNTTATSY